MATGVLLVAATAWGLELFRFSESAVTAFRLGAYILFLAVSARALAPLFRRVSDEQVALYLEEHEPSLRASLLTAVEAGEEAHAQPLLRRLVDDALGRIRAVEFGDRIERRGLWTSSGILAGAVVAGLFLFLFGPATLRHGATALLFPQRDAAELTPYSIGVTPGDSTVARGSDPVIRARLEGFRSGEVELMVATGEGGSFEALPMFPGEEEGAFEHLLVDVDEPLRYFVRSSGVRSSTFTLEVAELPYVDRLDLTYRFPGYTGLEPRTVEDGGDVAALPGTRVRVEIAPTVSTPGGRLVLDDSGTVELESGPEGRLTGEFTVEEPGGYRVELEGPDGRLAAASPHFTIDLLSDQPPSVRFEEPASDRRASPIEEVFLEAEADDDYGVAALDLVYAVNGGAQDTVRLYGDGSTGLREVSAGHTLFLEEWDLSPGDVIAYHAVARDGKRRGGPGKAVSDIFFVTVRPFRKDFSAADNQGQPGGGGGGMDAQSSLVEIQRQIVSATFNLERDRELTPDEEWRADVASVAVSQEDLRGQVEGLVAQMETRLGSVRDGPFRVVAEELPKAAEAMGEALEHLEERAVQEALAPEQTALRHLQRADEAYREVQVALQEQAAAGSGGEQRPPAEDLADLFQLELDKMENQYETVQRGGREQAENAIDETLERLKELARRQQQEAEREERRLRGQQQGAPSGGASQRALAEETEEAARRLERLAREQGTPELEETARRLREAAEAMRRSAAGGGGSSSADARRAAEELDDARRLLEEARSNRVRNDVERALERARALQQRQEEVARETDEVAGSRDRERIRRLQARKDQMAEALEGLEEEIDGAAGRARDEAPEAARSLRDAAGTIREDRVKEKIRFSKGLVERGDPRRARAFEEEIARDLEGLVERLEEAREGAEEGTRADPLEEALDEARSLNRGMETLDRRLREAGRSGGEEGESAEGQRGQEGAQGEGGTQGEAAGAEGRAQGTPSAEGGGRGGQAGRAPGSAVDPGPWGGGPPTFEGETARQFRREYRERAEAAEGLRSRLEEAGRPTADVEEALEALRALDDARVYDDAEEVLRLQAAAIEAIGRVEFALRREIQEREGPAVRLPSPDEVPAEFRELVEEYYRSLSSEETPPR